MNDVTFTILENRKIGEGIYAMRCADPDPVPPRPGQFVNLSLPGFFLRRPISVCDYEDGVITLVYKVVGEGTALMARLQPGTELMALTNLGNGFDLSRAGTKPLLLGGGMGVAPLYLLAKGLIARGAVPTVVVGFANAGAAMLIDEFKALGCPVIVMSDDGSIGKKGFVTGPMAELEYSYYYTCGPAPMFRAVHKAAAGEGESSLEERMGCGFGACMGCTIDTNRGPKRVCKDGPVFPGGDLKW